MISVGWTRTHVRNDFLRHLAVAVQLKMRELRESFGLGDVPEQIVFRFVPYVDERKACEVLQRHALESRQTLRG